MNKANECTCPSGDGSLVHPCPAHPAVEQAGGDERAAFEAWLAQAMSHHFDPDLDLAKYEDSGEYRYNPAADYWKAWQARAALAQPSLDHAVQAHDIPMLIASEHANPDYAMGWNDCRAKIIGASSAVQAERPEVVAWQYRVTAGPQTGWSLWHPGKGEEFERSYTVERRPLMTVAQHERIVGALRADRDSWAEQAERRLADWDEMRKERDAALARVAELEAKLSDPTAVHQWQFSNAWFDCSEEALLKAGKEGSPFRTLYAGPVAQAQQLHDLDKQCRDDVARALGLRPNQERGFAWSYLLASIKSCVKASEDSAQAQHSVPEGWKLVPLKVTEAMVTAFADCDGSDQDCYSAMLAAAPGKEGV